MNFRNFLTIFCIIRQYCVCLDRPIEIYDVNTLSNRVEDLDAVELWKYSQKSKSEASEIFMEKYGGKPIKITRISTSMIWNNRLIIDYSLAEKFLSLFGDLIESLAIEFVSIPTNRHKIIGDFVNLYCSGTLIDFEVNNCSEGTFDGMKKPFKRVESVIFDGEWENLNNNSLSFDQLFPEMRSLALIYSTGYILEKNYPKLNELSLNAPNLNLIKLLQSNPQIQELTVRHSSAKFLKIVSDNLPNLEVISFDVPYDLDPSNAMPINFDSVKNASINDLNGRIKNCKFRFENLNSIEVLVEEDVSAEWNLFMTSFDRQKSIIISISNFTENVLNNLSSNLNSSIEVRLGCNPIEMEPLANFLNSNKELKELVLNCPKNTQSFFDRLDYWLDEEWKIAPVNNSKCSAMLTKMDIAPDQQQEGEIISDTDQMEELHLEPLSNYTETNGESNHESSTECMVYQTTAKPQNNGAENVTSLSIKMSILTLSICIMNRIF